MIEAGEGGEASSGTGRGEGHGGEAERLGLWSSAFSSDLRIEQSFPTNLLGENQYLVGFELGPTLSFSKMLQSER